jgi:hypothetical protein
LRDLTNKRLSQLSKALEAAQAAFREEIDKLAEAARSEILPYFQKHDLDYLAGNGDWYITRNNNRVGDEHFVHNDALPANIRALLMLEVAHGDHLGFYIRDIRRGEA